MNPLFMDSTIFPFTIFKLPKRKGVNAPESLYKYNADISCYSFSVWGVFFCMYD
jgi:hypothetical protein